MRFLQFIFQGVLWQDSRLWQPGAGQPFFFKNPEKPLGEIDLFQGFAIRTVLHPEGGFGLVVDLRRKLVSRSPLPTRARREQINGFKGRSYVYKMGYKWFEITLSGLADVSIGTPSIPLNGKAVSLIDYLNRTSPKPVPPSIANLSPEGSAIYYRTSGPEQRAAPAALCHLVEDTHGRHGARHQRETIIDPYSRHRQINRLVTRFLKHVPVNNVILSVSDRAGRASNKPFLPPNLRFGNGVKLGIDRNAQSAYESIRDYGRSRLQLLKNKNAGFFEKSLLDQQYLVLPRSVENSYGSRFIKDLKAQVDDLYPNGGGYNPGIIIYDDLNVRRDVVGQSHAIREAVEIANVKPGYALVMVHRYDRRPRSVGSIGGVGCKGVPGSVRTQGSRYSHGYGKKCIPGA